MRRQSWTLVTASNQTSGKGVLFSAESNGMVQIPDFRRAHHYKVSKNLLLGCQHQKGLFTRTGLKVLRVSVKWTIRDVLKACVTTILRLFTCRTREHELAWGGLRLAGGFPTRARKDFRSAPSKQTKKYSRIRAENRSPATAWPYPNWLK